MPTGLAMPVGVGQDGGARLAVGDENDDKIMRLALGDDSNENAFQQNVGLGADMVFGQADDLLIGVIVRRLQDVFRRFEAQKRYRLLQETIRWSQDSKGQELILEFRYVSTESDRALDFRQAFSPSASNQ